tara:strand:+ start:63 stop:530 length:468 start_codon:yes stop_codon:yes gene_type:complete
MSNQSELRSLLETVGVVIGSLVIAIVIIVVATKKYDSPKPVEEVVKTDGQENVTPVAIVKVEESDSFEAPSSSISGDMIVKANCAMCHSTGLMNSPKIGDKAQWEPRIAQGKDLLVSNAINGIRTMPAKGGNASLTDSEMEAAVIFMVNSSGGNF